MITIKSEGVKTHTVMRGLLRPVLREFRERGWPAEAADVHGGAWCHDPGGAVWLNDRRLTFDLRGAQVSVLMQHAEWALDHLRKNLDQAVRAGKYVKVYGAWHVLCLTPRAYRDYFNQLQRALENPERP